MPDWESLKDRVVWVSRLLGSQKALAERSGVAPRTVGDLARGKGNPTRATIQKLADAADVDADWLLTGRGRPTSSVFDSLGELRETPEEHEEFEAAFHKGLSKLLAAKELAEQPTVTPASIRRDSNVVSLPRYAVQASAGNGLAVLAEEISDYMSVSRDWLQRMLPSWAPRNAAVGILEGAGDSMEPTVSDGDLLMIVRDLDWRRQIALGGIFVFTHDGDLKLKRLQTVAGDLKIISDNPNYETETVPGEEIDHRCQFHGQVFFVGGRPRIR